MTITLTLSDEQENRLRAGAARKDARAVREILLQVVDSTVERLLDSAQSRPSSLSTTLDRIASRLRDAPALTDEAVSRVGIYVDHS